MFCNTFIKRFVVGLGTFFILLFFTVVSNAETNSLAAGQKAPHFSLIDSNNISWVSKNFFNNNKLVIFYFFDIESEACLQELEFLSNINKNNADYVDILAITSNDSDKLSSFIRDKKINITILVDKDRMVSNLYHAISVFPTTFFINEKRDIIEVVVGSPGDTESVLSLILQNEKKKEIKENAIKKTVAEITSVTAPAIADTPKTGKKEIENDSIYKEYSSLKKVRFFFDEFDDNRNNWSISNKETHQLNILKGYYRFDHFRNEKLWRVWKKLEIDKDKSFEIEARILIDKNSHAHVRGFFIEDRYGNKWVYGINECNKYYFYYDNKGKGYENIIKWTASSYIHNGNFNILTLRKINNQFYFFVNKEFLQATPSMALDIKSVGFQLSRKSAVYIDYLKVSFIERE